MEAEVLNEHSGGMFVCRSMMELDYRRDEEDRVPDTWPCKDERLIM